MEKLEVFSQIEVLDLNELSPDEVLVLDRAMAISKRAYSPYSGFHVGAAIRLENGEVFQSSNQENVSFPTGVCAELLVMGYALANFPDSAPEILAVAAQREGEDSWAGVSPCGICRQTINESELRFGKPVTMLFFRPDRKVFRVRGIRNLLPLKFDDLKS